MDSQPPPPELQDISAAFQNFRTAPYVPTDPAFYWASGEPAMKVSLPTVLMGAILRYCVEAKGDRTAGLLIGHYKSSGSHPDPTVLDLIEITAVLAAPPDSKVHEDGRFELGSEGVEEFLEQVKEYYYYVGDWIYNPGGAAAPLEQDIESIFAVASSDDAVCLQPLALYIGGNVPGEAYALPYWFTQARQVVGLKPSGQVL